MYNISSYKFIFEYRTHFHSMLHKHGGKCPNTGRPSLKHVKDKSSFFKELKATWAARKKSK